MSTSNLHFRKLDGTNYAEWSIMMEAWLIKKGLWEIANGTETLIDAGSKAKAVRAYEKCAAECRAEIVLHVEESQLSYVRNRDLKVIWDTFWDTYQARGYATRRALRRKFIALTKSDEMTMPAWIAEVRKHAYKLEECGVDVADEDIIMVLTAGLSPAYENFIITLDATPDDEFTLNYVITCLLNEEA
jgi:hypothetical protein